MSIQIGIQTIHKAITNIPNSSGVYKMINASDEVIYVGKAKNLNKRVHQYSQITRLPNRLRLMVSSIRKIEIILTEKESDALLLEAQLIKGLKPTFNIALKDDKSFPYIAIDHSHVFPRLFKYRGSPKKEHIYFGPFLNAEELDKIIIYIQKIYRLRSCSDKFFARRQRPCLLHQIKRCSAPCTQKITLENYSQDIKHATKILSGELNATRNDLIKQMEIASDALEFEKAAAIRDVLQSLNGISGRQSIEYFDFELIDVIAFYSKQSMVSFQVFRLKKGRHAKHESFTLESLSEGNELVETFLLDYYDKNPIPDALLIGDIEDDCKCSLSKTLKVKIISAEKEPLLIPIYNAALKNAKHIVNQQIAIDKNDQAVLDELTNVFGLEGPIKRIEVYDNSHIHGHHAVGCMVVHDGYCFVKERYKVFKIQNETDGDDYAMLQEVFCRRFRKFNEYPKPDLILIDGGKQHLAVALDVLVKLQIQHLVRVVAIAKGIKRNAGEETFYVDNGAVINFPKDNKVLYYMQKLRDEVHRFAVSTHRKLMSRDSISSAVAQMPGIGKARQKILLSTFGSYEKIKEASLNDLMNTPKLGKKLIVQIYNYLHKIKDE